MLILGRGSSCLFQRGEHLVAELQSCNDIANRPAKGHVSFHLGFKKSGQWCTVDGEELESWKMREIQLVHRLGFVISHACDPTPLSCSRPGLATTAPQFWERSVKLGFWGYFLLFLLSMKVWGFSWVLPNIIIFWCSDQLCGPRPKRRSLFFFFRVQK